MQRIHERPGAVRRERFRYREPHIRMAFPEGIIEARARLSDYARLLPDGLLGQCRKSYIVNIMYVRRIESSSLTLATREVVPIGRKYMQGFFSLFHTYHRGRARKNADDIGYAFPSEALHRAQCQ